MPAEAKLLSVGLQKGKVCLWALVDPSKPIETKMIEIVGTGNPMPNDGLVRKFIGTVVADPFVWHVFEPFTVRSIENQTMVHDICAIIILIAFLIFVYFMVEQS